MSLRVTDLWLDLGEFHLRGVHLEIVPGEYFIILGPTGAGKTVLLETIAGLHCPRRGHIFLNGADVTRVPPERRSIGFVYQDYALFPHLSVAENIAFGLRLRGMDRRAILERELKRLGLGELSHEAVAALFGYEKVEDFLAAIGFGDINSQQIAAKVVEAQQQAQPEPELLPPAPIPAPVSHEVHVLGTGGLLTRLARCCHPLPGEPIIGYVTQGHGITIHRRDCPNILNLRHPERLIEVTWGTEQRTFPVLVSVLAYDRTGLLHDISEVLAKEKVNIAGVSIGRQNHLTTIYLTLEVTDIGQLGRVLARISKVPNVIEAQRQTR